MLLLCVVLQVAAAAAGREIWPCHQPSHLRIRIRVARLVERTSGCCTFLQQHICWSMCIVDLAQAAHMSGLNLLEARCFFPCKCMRNGYPAWRVAGHEMLGHMRMQSDNT